MTETYKMYFLDLSAKIPVSLADKDRILLDSCHCNSPWRVFFAVHCESCFKTIQNHFIYFRFYTSHFPRWSCSCFSFSQLDLEEKPNPVHDQSRFVYVAITGFPCVACALIDISHRSNPFYSKQLSISMSEEHHDLFSISVLG